MKFKFDDLNKVQIAKAIQMFAFWVPIAMLFFRSKGLSDSQIYSLLGSMQFYNVVLEYPTGVIGDVFGHRVSLLFGYLIGGLSFILLGSSMEVSYLFMHVMVFLSACASAFISGSDIALLHSVSVDFKKDVAWSNQFAGIFQSIGLAVGGLIGAVSLNAPFILTGICFLISFVIILTVKVKEKKEESLGLIKTAVLGVQEAVLNKKLFYPVFLSSIIIMYTLTEKWVLPEVFTRAQIPVALFGIVTAIVFFFRSYASAVYRKVGDKPYWIPIIGLVLASILVSFNYISILGLLLVYGFATFITTQTDISINENVDGRARASVISFRNLFARLINSPYLWILGIASTKLEFPGVNLVMSGVLVAFILLISAIFLFRSKALVHG